MQISRKLLVLALLCAIFLAALPLRSYAQEDDMDVSDGDVPTEYEDDSPLDDSDSVEVDDEVQVQQFVSPAADVSTWVKFLGISDDQKTFVAGEEVTALIGMHNSGSNTYNVSYIGAHLHSPYDEKFFVQNFTVRWVSAIVPPKSEVTLEYRFRPDEKLETLDFLLSGWLIYNDSQVPTQVIYRNLFVNQTVEVQERRAPWNVQSAVTWALGLAGVAVVGYALAQQQGGVAKSLQSVLGKKAKRSQRREPAASPAASSDADNSPVASGWDTKVYRPAPVQKAVGSKKTKPVSKQ